MGQATTQINVQGRPSSVRLNYSTCFCGTVGRKTLPEEVHPEFIPLHSCQALNEHFTESLNQKTPKILWLMDGWGAHTRNTSETQTF